METIRAIERGGGGVMTNEHAPCCYLPAVAGVRVMRLGVDSDGTIGGTTLRNLDDGNAVEWQQFVLYMRAHSEPCVYVTGVLLGGAPFLSASGEFRVRSAFAPWPSSRPQHRPAGGPHFWMTPDPCVKPIRLALVSSGVLEGSSLLDESTGLPARVLAATLDMNLHRAPAVMAGAMVCASVAEVRDDCTFVVGDIAWRVGSRGAPLRDPLVDQCASRVHRLTDSAPDTGVKVAP